MPQNDRPRVLQLLSLVLTALVLAVLSCTELRAEPAVAANPGARAGAGAGAGAAVDASGVSIAAISREAWDLAEQGKIDQVLERVRQAVAEAEEGSALSVLSRDLATHEEHVRHSRDKAQAEYQKHLAKVDEHLGSGDLAEALLSARQAHDLAEDQRAMLAEPRLAELIQRSEAKAQEFESQGRWLKSLTLYGRLWALHEQVDRDRYAEPLRRVSARVGLLQLYAPAVFFDMLKQNAAEEGDPEPEPSAFEENGWQVQLEGLSHEMLMEAMAYAAQAHVEGTRYEEMIRGGIDMLRVVLTTKGLETTFPALADAQSVARFSEGLDAIVARLDKSQGRLRDSDAGRIVREILKRNDETLKLPAEVVLHEFGDGAMGVLDEFSGIIWPHAKQRFDRTTTQKFTGVGIQISLVERGAKAGAAVAPGAAGEQPIQPTTRHQLTVVTPLEGSPAQRAGIRPGDRIVSIDGKSTAGIGLDTAVDKITGPEGTQVTLGIQSPGSDDPREIVLTRASIPIASVRGWSRSAGGSWDYYIDPALKIGYVRMTQFGPDTAGELDSAVQAMLNGQGLKGLILDLRFNPGGRLDAAIDVADRFIEKGIIVSTTGRPLVAMASGPKTYPRLPVIVLVNGASASASEIVSGALKDHDRALIVGQRSFGKGSVQNLFPIGDKAAYLKLTTQYYKLPDGRIIHRRPSSETWGVDPDVAVRMTARQTVTAAQARTLLDILREDGEEIDPSYVLNLGNGEEDDEQDQLPPIDSAQDILSLGLDPQLETALLLMKTKVIGESQG